MVSGQLQVDKVGGDHDGGQPGSRSVPLTDAAGLPAHLFRGVPRDRQSHEANVETPRQIEGDP